MKVETINRYYNKPYNALINNKSVYWNSHLIEFDSAYCIFVNPVALAIWACVSLCFSLKSRIKDPKFFTSFDVQPDINVRLQYIEDIIV